MRDDLKRLLGATFGVPADDVPDDAAAGRFEPWNSLGHLELLMAVEAEYGVVIPMERMAALASLDAIEEYLGARGVFGRA